MIIFYEHISLHFAMGDFGECPLVAMGFCLTQQRGNFSNYVLGLSGGEAFSIICSYCCLLIMILNVFVCTMPSNSYKDLTRFWVEFSNEFSVFWWL